MKSLMEGPMWFDNDPTRSNEDKIVLALKHYQREFICCLVNPTVVAHITEMAGITVVPSLDTMPNHFHFITEIGGEKDLTFLQYRDKMGEISIKE